MVDFAKLNKHVSFRNYLEELLQKKKMGEQSDTDDVLVECHPKKYKQLKEQYNDKARNRSIRIEAISS